jgi:hypothetical protein
VTNELPPYDQLRLVSRNPLFTSKNVEAFQASRLTFVMRKLTYIALASLLNGMCRARRAATLKLPNVSMFFADSAWLLLFIVVLADGGGATTRDPLEKEHWRNGARELWE